MDSTGYFMTPQIRAMRKLEVFENKLSYHTVSGAGHDMTAVQKTLGFYADRFFK